MTSASRQTAYFAQQAERCAAAASVTTVAEIKQAYLALEQGWRHLFPERSHEHDAPKIESPIKTCIERIDKAAGK